MLDEDGMPTRIDLRVKNDATSMIEEAMIAANECVASHLHRKKLPCVYRIHESALRTFGNANSAINAGVRIYNILFFANVESANRTNRSASTAFNTVVIYY